MQISEIEFVHRVGGKIHPKSNELGRGRVIAMSNGEPLTPIQYKSKDRAMKDLRNRGLIA